MTALGPALNQKNPKLRPGGPKSINDCWVVAGTQAGRAVGGRYTGADSVVIDGMSIPTIVAFRRFAGKPDVNGAAGAGGLDDIEKGIHGAYKGLVTFQTKNFKTFLALARAGKVAAVIVDSSKLPARFRYGFNGIHAVTIRMVVTTTAETLYGINPLQPQGSAAVKLTSKEVEAAFIGAVMVRAADPDPAPEPPVPPQPEPAPGPCFSQKDIDDATTAGYVKGVAETKAAAHIVYE